MNRKVTKLFAIGATVALATTAFGTAVAAQEDGYNLGFSNPGGVGNGWREEQWCSVRAQALASGEVKSLNSIHRQTDPSGQIEDINNLRASGVDAIVLNPSDGEALNTAIKAATDEDIVVVAIDSEVTEPSAYNISNDQEKYAQIGAEWLFETIGGEGNVYYVRGAAGHPADDSRDIGFQRALESYPGITITHENFTKWDQPTAKQQMADLILSGQKFDGIWTSGLGQPVVEAFVEQGEPLVPMVGADSAGYVGFLNGQGNGTTVTPEDIADLVGVAVTNPGTIGGAGVTLALQILDGNPPAENVLYIDPILWDNQTEEGQALIAAGANPDINPLWPVALQIEGWTSYDDSQLLNCQGPGA